MRKLIIKIHKKQNIHDGYCSDSYDYRIEEDTEVIKFPIIYCQDYINSYIEDNKFIGGSNELKIYAKKALWYSWQDKERPYSFRTKCYKIIDLDKRAFPDSCGSGYCNGYLIRTLLSVEVVDEIKKD